MKIDGITHEGWGVGRLEGMAIFVEGAMPGETVKAEVTHRGKSFMRAKSVEVLEPSTYRAVPFCPHYGQCGGCNLQHVSYQGQLELKRRIVADAFKRLGGIKEPGVMPLIGMEDPFHYRNKAEFRVWKAESGKYSCGFRMRNSHEAVELTGCKVLQPSILEPAQFLVDELNVASSSSYMGLRHIVTRANLDGKSMITMVSSESAGSGHKKVAERIMGAFTDVASVYHCFNRNRYGEVLQGSFTLLAGQGKLPFEISGNSFLASPRSFLQVNSRQVEVLYKTAVGYADLNCNQSVLDIFCGMGTITLMLARRAKKALGIELNGIAVADAKESSARNGIHNTSFLEGKAEDLLVSDHVKSFDAQVAVVDPPRAGCDPRLIRAIAESNMERIVYVSCDPATLARDTSLLLSKGFDLDSLEPVDMFPHTSHVEMVALLTRNKTSK